MQLTKEQQSILENNSKRVVVSASAGSGKTFVLVEKLISLICDKRVPVSRLLVLTFTKAAAQEMKSRLLVSLLAQKPDPFILEQIDELSIGDISTIDSFCEKIIKRNISKLDVDEGFTIIDERSANLLKHRAFASAYEKFSRDNEKFNTIYFAFKKNKDRIEECMLSMQNFFDSVSDEKNIRHEFLNNFNNYLEKAKESICHYLNYKIDRAKTILNNAMQFGDMPQSASDFVRAIQSQLVDMGNKDFYRLCNQISNIFLPDLPRVKMDSTIKKMLAQAKELIKVAKNLAGNYKDINNNQIKQIEEGKLAKTLMELYDIYYARYTHYKKNRSVLDFADIERFAFVLLQDELIKLELQQRYDYIFIDEYQDTNTLQESILKPIAQGGYFTAVGDIKQGIYGFRNARKEIMLKDIDDFSSSEDGQALYLTGNFRTDKNILSFVNDVFSKIMTKQSSGIEYKEKSMLVGLQNFEEDGLPPISIDIVCQEKPDKTIRNEVYSVQREEMLSEDKFLLELQTIESRINEALSTKIYDAKNKQFRGVKQSDISLLFRGRSQLMKECVKYLRERGFSVDADIKSDLLDDSQIRIICSLLKLTLNKQDDISLAATMASVIGGFSLQELAEFRLQQESGEFWDIVLNSQNEKVKTFVLMIDQFSQNCQIFGIIKAVQMLLEGTGYYSYLKTLLDGKEKLARINELFKMIKALDCDFKPATLISAIEANAKQKGGTEGSVDAINVTTIHATKGLEYPIVILCGCGENLSKVYNKNYILSNSFGLGSVVYDTEQDSQVYSPIFLAGKLEKEREEFEGELMIFYVALTRAQNHLYIIGSGKEKDFSFDDIEDQGSYLQFIMYALGENFTSQLFSQGKIITPNRRFQIVDSVEEKEDKILSKIINVQKNQNYEEKIKKYREFSYNNKKYCKTNYKNSVTGILKLEDDLFEKEIKVNSESKIETVYGNPIERGNAYHEALKLINLRAVNTLEDLQEELDRIQSIMTSGYMDLLDKDILYKNIILINDLTSNLEIFKEREFIMNCSLGDIGVDGEGEVIVQGVVDFFAIGEKNILIDFKFTSSTDKNEIINRYSKQIELYSKAIEKAFNLKLDEKYLLSLKNAQLIKL